MTTRVAATRRRRVAPGSLARPVGDAKTGCARQVRESLREEARCAFRDAILSAAERVFVRAGFYETRMADIAREAGVGVGTLYNYFESKEVIFSDLLALRHDEFRAAIEAAAVAEDPLERLRQIVRAMLSTLEQNGALFAVFMERGAVAEFDVERLAGANAARRYGELLELLETTVIAAMRARRLRSDADPRLLVAILSGAMNGAAYAWLERERQGPLSSVADDLVDLFLEGARVR